MLPDGRRVGVHLPLGMGMARAADRAAEIGAEAIQVFSDNPTAWRRRAEPPPELPAFRRRLSVLGVHPIAIHASYLVNLAGPDQEFWERSIAVLAHELRTADHYGAAFVNVHLGSHRGRGVEFGVARVAEAVARTFEAAGAAGAPDDPARASAADAPDHADGRGSAPVSADRSNAMLVLENSAGGGFGVGATATELEQILGAIERVGTPPERVGICLDAAHLWGAGHRISEPDEVDRVLDELDRRVGLARVRMVHLNDSRSELGSHTDRHQHVGAGQIGATGLRRLLTHPALGHVTYILETPGMDEGYDAINMDRVRRLVRGDPLPDLAPHELEMRGSRSRSAPADDVAEEVAAARPGAPPGRPRERPSRGRAGQ